MKTVPTPSTTGGTANHCHPGIGLRDLNWWVVFLVATVGGIFSAGTVVTSDLAERNPVRFGYPLLWEITGYYTAFCLLPLLVLGFKRFPIHRGNWQWALPLHILFSLAFGVAHTLLMLWSRTLAYSVLGLGHYDYGAMGYRFLMEYQKQLIVYWLVYAVVQILAAQRENRERERRAAALELHASELQRQLAQAQLEALRSQLNPHFLFNTLNMISSVMYEDADRADHMIAALSRMLRMSLAGDSESRVSVQRELEFVDCAVRLIEARFKDQVKIRVEREAGTENLLVPNMLVYTLLENAVKHHDREREAVMRIDIAIRRKDSRLSLEVVDNGPGISDFEKAMGNGVGLTNTRQRLQVLYGEAYQLELRNRPEGGLRVCVEIPAETAPEPAAISAAA